MRPELFRALGALAEPPSPESERLAELLGLGPRPAAGDYEELFLFQLSPWASVYLGAEGQLGGEARDRIAGFWRALELTPPDEPDHLALMLGLYARLAEVEDEADDSGTCAAWQHARRAWLWEHLLSWLPIYLDAVAAHAAPFYRAWGELLTTALEEGARELGPPAALPLHLRLAPELSDPRQGAGGAALLTGLLSPVTAGLIVTAGDLRRIAGEAGLGVRAGERRYALEALLAQDAAAVLERLAALAAERADRYRALTATFAPVTGSWRRRAEASAGLLADLARDAKKR